MSKLKGHRLCDIETLFEFDILKKEKENSK